MKLKEQACWVLVLAVAIGSVACNGANMNVNTNTNLNANRATPGPTPTVAREKTRSEYTEEEARQAREKAKSGGETIGDTLDDAWIHTKIVAKLIANTTTPERNINVDVVGNIVTLRGNVETPEEKTEAERVAKETEGVKQVKNQIRVTQAVKVYNK
jgi:hypothetical protein